MDTPQERVKIAVAESARLKDYLHSLPSEAWTQPSACDRWSIQDVVAHLAWTAESYTARTQQSLQEDVSPPAGASGSAPVNAASLADGNVQQAISRRERLGDHVFADFIAQNDQLNQLMATLSPDDWNKPHYYASLGIEPLRYRPDLWISELVMHGWDIRSRFEPETHLSDTSLLVLIEMLPNQLERFIFRSGSKLPTPIRYRWELTGMGGRRSDMVVEGDKATVEPATTEQADVTFRCDTESFVFIAFGRLTIDAAIGVERIAIEGDKELVRKYQQRFPGM